MENPIDQQLAITQLQHMQLENEKLSLELEKIRKGTSWLQLPLQLVPLISALVAVAGFLWGVLQYSDEQAKNRSDKETQSKRENAIAEREFMRPWLESQRQTYQEALTAATAIANSKESKDRGEAEQKFWQLYHGAMILVETKKVSGGMVLFGHCIDGTEACSQQQMNERSRDLATAMAESMAATAKMSYQEFVQNQFHYATGPA
ncbi:hypothetical protein [Undibacterium terreum]|uniref:Uncharacterized protein n=1 Tax=Undibacterium terreum TaxID=1224302 RepID=A0A916XQW9_9BURK|nr:hypothetical protein [Undibacterium terreum]GGD00228.1 hypothetical protein GCM10011396_54680 [Undibacterium terreum]